MTKTERRFPLLVACFVLSGLAGLIYETVWTQQFVLVFGTSELALATVLAAYMAGLALGAAVAGAGLTGCGGRSCSTPRSSSASGLAALAGQR